MEMVFEMVVLVAHEERHDPVSQDRARTAHGVVVMLFEERVLAHAADVHEGVDEEHRHEPRVQEHPERQPRQREEERPSQRHLR